MSTLARPPTLTAFGQTIQLLWSTVPLTPMSEMSHHCTSKQFYLSLPEIAHFLALPEKNQIIIQMMRSDIPIPIINTWLLGTMMAYILQYQGYLVLHGSAVILNHRAVIISGCSGAGKSTLASALVQQGHPFITDDLIVIKKDPHGRYCILPGPSALKLWSDSMHYFNHDTLSATPIHLKLNKYAIPIQATHHAPLIPISAFYALNTGHRLSCELLTGIASLKILMQNAYRYFMLHPLGKLPQFLKNCTALSQQIKTYQLIRTNQFQDIPKIIEQIQKNQGIVS